MNRFPCCWGNASSPQVGTMLFVKDKNLNRRQLTQSQKAMVAARMIPLYQDEAKSKAKKFFIARKKMPLNSIDANGDSGRTSAIVSDMVGDMDD